MATQEHMEIGKDKETQEMVHKAEREFPNLDKSEAIQMEANKGPGREAEVGEGAPKGLMQSVKETVAGAAEAVKQANPGTRDMREKHC